MLRSLIHHSLMSSLTSTDTTTPLLTSRLCLYINLHRAHLIYREIHHSLLRIQPQSVYYIDFKYLTHNISITQVLSIIWKLKLANNSSCSCFSSFCIHFSRFFCSWRIHQHIPTLFLVTSSSQVTVFEICVQPVLSRYFYTERLILRS